MGIILTFLTDRFLLHIAQHPKSAPCTTEERCEPQINKAVWKKRNVNSFHEKLLAAIYVNSGPFPCVVHFTSVQNEKAATKYWESSCASPRYMFMHRVWSQRIHIKLLRKAKTLDTKIGKQSDFKHVWIENEENVTSRRNHFPPPRRPHGRPGCCPAVALFSTCGSCRHQSAARSTHCPKTLQLAHNPPASSWVLTLPRRRFSSHHNGSNAVTAVSDDAQCLRCHFLGGCLLWDSTQDHEHCDCDCWD